MTATKTTEKTTDNLIKGTLPSGIKVEFDPSKSTGHTLMKARKASGGFATVIYIMAEIATFDGEKLPAPEILNYQDHDVIAIEELWESAKPGK